PRPRCGQPTPRPRPRPVPPRGWCSARNSTRSNRSRIKDNLPMWYLLRYLKLAITALFRNVMRSVLTTLGITIGVAAVVIVVESGDANNEKVRKNIEDLGANMILVMPGASAVGGVSAGSGTQVTLTPDDADALGDSERCPAIQYVAPIV